MGCVQFQVTGGGSVCSVSTAAGIPPNTWLHVMATHTQGQLFLSVKAAPGRQLLTTSGCTYTRNSVAPFRYSPNAPPPFAVDVKPCGTGGRSIGARTGFVGHDGFAAVDSFFNGTIAAFAIYDRALLPVDTERLGVLDWAPPA